MSLIELQSFFGYMTAINLGLLIFSAIFITAFGDWAVKLHRSLFKLEEQEIRKSYFNYLALYKIGIILFNLVPYLALCSAQ